MLRTVFFGTPDFAVPCLERLLAGTHPVVAVVSQPDRPRGRGRKTTPSPVAEVAKRAGLPLFQPERATDTGFQDALRACNPDIGVVAAFGQFLPRALRELPSQGYLINAHASLLPRYRGAAPIARSLLDGEPTTGISVMKIVREMDAGPVALQRELEIQPTENAGDLEKRLARVAADLIQEAVEAIADESLAWTDQDHARATPAPKLTRNDALLDWREDAEVLARRIRAMAPKPGATTHFRGAALRILEARTEAADDAPGASIPGCVVRTETPSAPLHVVTGRGWLVPLQLQRAGGRVLSIEEFLRGRDIPDGSRLGDAKVSSC